jgi:hypothetical protein
VFDRNVNNFSSPQYCGRSVRETDSPVFCTQRTVFITTIFLSVSHLSILQSVLRQIHSFFQSESKLMFLRSNYSTFAFVVCFLLSDSTASEFFMPTFRNTLSVPSSLACKCTVFRNVGIKISDAGESPRIKHTKFIPNLKFEIKNLLFSLGLSSSCLRLLPFLLVPSILPSKTCYRTQFSRRLTLYVWRKNNICACYDRRHRMLM